MTHLQAVELKLTALEESVLESLINQLYAEPGFSDVGVLELSDGTNLRKNVVKGVVGSLCKKDILFVDEEYENIVYLHSPYWYLHPEWNVQIEEYHFNKSEV